MINNAQSQVELALNLWVNGDRDGFKKIVTEQLPNIKSYRGAGDIMTYFLPALYMKDFCLDLLETGFPFEVLVDKEPNVYAWLSWMPACEYMSNKDIGIFTDVLENSFPEEAYVSWGIFDSLGEDYKRMMEYYPTALKEAFKIAIEVYDTAPEAWNKRFANCEIIVNGFTDKKCEKCNIK